MAQALGGRARHRSGIATRLVGLVLVPLLAVTALAAVVVTDARDASRRAHQIEELVPAVSRLARLLDAVSIEQASAQVLLRSADLGYTPETALELLGPEFEPGPARTSTDAVLRAVQVNDGPLPFDGADLEDLRRRVDEGRIDGDGADQRYIALVEQVSDVLAVEVEHLQQQAITIIDGQRVAQSLEALVAVLQAMEATGVQFNQMAPLLMGSPDDELEARAIIAAATARLDDANRQLAASGHELAYEWAELMQPQYVGVVQEVVSLVMQGGTAEDGLDISRLIEVGQAGGRFQAATHDLILRAGDMAEAAATELRTASESRYRTTLLAVAVAYVVTLVLAVAIGRSIARPLLGISARAAAIGDGDLDVPAVKPRGPRAIRVVASAFNDLVANLRLLETKSQALANCDFDNPVLEQPLPGRLGESIQASVSMLSGSIEERDMLQRRLAHQAIHDHLTGLQNRAGAISALEHALARGRRAGEPVSVLFCDLDGFKLINDTYGHDVGDIVLIEIAGRMLHVVREGDVVARLGGDEFLVIAERTSDVEATALARRIVASVAEPITAGSRQLSVAASVGIALSVDGSGDPFDFLARADLALYRAKAHGRACVELYDESLQRELLRRSEVEAALGVTLAAGGDELELHYQPVVAAADGAVRAVEALVRWRRPGIGIVAPDEFIPVAEATDLIIDLDVWVLRTAARHVMSWPTDGAVSSATSVSVNVSGRHLLSERLHDNVRQVLDEIGLDPRRLVLEVTETVLLTDIPAAATQLSALRELGVRVAVDDFGTGYTSLSALQGLPIDTIKVDRSFVAAIHEQRQRSLVALVAQLGRQLGVNVVAEGVETVEQRLTLQNLGCHEIQGFLVGRPVPEPELFAALDAARS